ncbi:MAG TPA: VWA domain-containing protein, partial [Tepidisphaeraceae bacterium]|nr:VWA domain-containing protein [Tepidisphaeraceae bacterium]
IGLFVGLGAIVVVLGMHSLAGLGKVRQWVAIVIRLLVILLFILILGNVKWDQQNKNVEVLVLRDIGQSTTLARDFPGDNLQGSLDQWLVTVGSDDPKANPSKRPDDTIGQIVFNETPSIDLLPDKEIMLNPATAIRNAGTGTDAAAAIQMALATMSHDAMHRMVLIWDGNATQGDVEAAATAAAAEHVPIDVMPIDYAVTNEVMVDNITEPSWRNEKQPFTLDIYCRSINPSDVTATLTVDHQTEQGWVPMPLDGEKTERPVTLRPGYNVYHVFVPPQLAGVHQFRANLTNVSKVLVDGREIPGDTIPGNNTAEGFTFVSGKGQVLFVDDVEKGEGQYLMDAMEHEGMNVRRISPGAFPTSDIELQNYDAVVMANVARGFGGLSEDQQRMLASYVHDQGGGLVMIGGDHAFGAGGWQGSDLEKQLPVDMEIPAQRQIPKGALVMIMHACEFPDGNRWGELCAKKAAETLSAEDDVGIVDYGMNGGEWVYPLQPKGDGAALNSAIDNMTMGDMPSFDETMDIALNGKNGQKGLRDDNDARQKHIIIISDGDPAPPNEQLLEEAEKKNITVSVIRVYPHGPDNLSYIAQRLHGKTYGPITDNLNVLPQIFIKEAQIVRRTIIYEKPEGWIPILVPESQLVKGLSQADIPRMMGMDLTTPKQSPLVEIPLRRPGNIPDPILANWTTGLGKSAVFTSDVAKDWDGPWIESPIFDQFWHQVIDGVARSQASRGFDTRITLNGNRAHLVIEAVNKDNDFSNNVDFNGTVSGGPNLKAIPIRPVQTAPGLYEADFDAKDAGSYIAYLNFVGPPGPNGQPGQTGHILSGVVVNTSPEMRFLNSDDAVLRNVARITGGRVLTPFDAANADLFDRNGLTPTSSPQSIIQYLFPALLALILIDVAARRIAWDRAAIRKMLATLQAQVRDLTVASLAHAPGTGVQTQSIDALKRIKTGGEGAAEPKAPTGPAAPVTPDRTAKFEAKDAVEGDISQVVGGASDKPVPPPPKKIEPKGAPGGTLGGLMEAKRRAQQKIREKERDQNG